MTATKWIVQEYLGLIEETTERDVAVELAHKVASSYVDVREVGGLHKLQQLRDALIEAYENDE